MSDKSIFRCLGGPGLDLTATPEVGNNPLWLRCETRRLGCQVVKTFSTLFLETNGSALDKTRPGVGGNGRRRRLHLPYLLRRRQLATDFDGSLRDEETGV